MWDRKVDGGFPEIKVLKQKVRDIISPDRSLGHSDNVNNEAATEKEIEVDEIDDDDAEDLRRFYGVL